MLLRGGLVEQHAVYCFACPSFRFAVMGRRSSKRVRTPTATITESGDQPEEGIEEEELNNDKIEEIQLEEEGEEGEYEIGE